MSITQYIKRLSCCFLCDHLTKCFFWYSDHFRFVCF